MAIKFSWIAIYCVVLALCGCADDSPARPQLFPVSGMVVVAGKPAAGVTLSFHAISGSLDAALVPSATTGPDGTFQVQTFSLGDGAPSGEYRVSACWWNDAGGGDDSRPVDRLKSRYADPAKSSLKVTVAQGSNQLPPIVLK